MTRTLLLIALALPGMTPALRGQTSNAPTDGGGAQSFPRFSTRSAATSQVSTTRYGAASDLPDSANAWRNERQRKIDRDKQLKAQVASVQVAVFGAVYDDRTFEGDADWIFTVRRRNAALAQHILDYDLKVEFPSSREENRKAMGILRTAGFHPPEEALSRVDWESIRADVQRDAQWWES